MDTERMAPLAVHPSPSIPFSIMRNLLVGACCSVLLAGCFMPASIQNRANERERDRVGAAVAEQWQRLDADAASRGWQPVGEPRQGVLQETYNPSDELRIDLPATGEYNIVGMCGPNCRDMDIVVWNAARQRVGADLEPDAVPIVAFRGNAGERFTATVTIPDCSKAAGQERWSCAYFTRVYRR